MKANLVNPADRNAILARLDQLGPDSERLWGTMSPTQMLTHVGEQVRICLGDKPAKKRGNALVQRLAKWYSLQLRSFPKNMRTIRELHPTGGLMTPPTEFEADRKTLRTLLDRLTNLPDGQPLAHPVFGTLSKSELGQLTYLHLDHHLRQFGV
jgi:hypothetical protein